MAGDQSVALQVAQRLSEHALGDVADGSVKLDGGSSTEMLSNPL